MRQLTRVILVWGEDIDPVLVPTMRLRIALIKIVRCLSCLDMILKLRPRNRRPEVNFLN